MFGSLTIPAEIVTLLGGSVVVAIGWQIRMTIALLRDTEVLKTQLADLLAQCPICKLKT
jgi:hypothetical protein